MVRLKVETGAFLSTLQSLFQFHYGSIKGNCICRNAKQFGTFQFHYGSIKGLSSASDMV